MNGIFNRLKRVQRHLLRQSARLGSRRFCPCCERRSGRFLGLNEVGFLTRDDAVCPWCGSMERQRLLIHHFVAEKKVAPQERLEVLHFASDACLELAFARTTRWNVMTADLFAPAVAKEDITRMSFPERRFDLILCLHVIDHVRDDAAAMKEMHRVLKPGGRAFIMSLIDFGAPKTLEFADANVAGKRPKGYDELRCYGADFVGRLEAAGFRVDVVDYAKSLPDELRNQYGVAGKVESGRLNLTAIFECLKAASA